MRVSELAKRYAKAVFELAGEKNSADKILGELRALEAVFEKDKAIQEFVQSPLTKNKEMENALISALKGAGLSDITLGFVLLLAQKGRMRVLPEIIEALKAQSDLSNGVTRGNVRSAAVLAPDERKRIEEIVGRFTQKQVILTYKEDPSLIGGLIAEVGSYTFDDTLTSHLRRLKDETTRRVQ